IVAVAVRKRRDPRFWFRHGTDSLVRRRCLQPVLAVSSCVRPRNQVSLRRILVPLDGSSTSECALPCAAGLAATTGARLTLLRVVPWMLRPWYSDDPTPALVA